MRAIFFVLLIANLAFFGHQFFFAENSKPVNVKQVGVSNHSSQNNLQLLSELGERNSLTKKADSHVAVVQGGATATATGSGDLCTMIGPYEQLLQAEYAVERMNALGVVAHITPVEIQEGESFWVYLKPEKSEKEAVRRLYELQKKNIESHVITKGELANGISFGRYADYTEAEIKLNEVKNQGYDVAIKRLPKTIQETWVILDTGFAEKVDESVWVDLLSKQTGLEKRQNYCLGVASQ